MRPVNCEKTKSSKQRHGGAYLDDDLAGSVVVDDLEFADVAVLLHRLEELHDDLRRRPDQHLPLPALLGVRDRLQAVSEHRHAHHLADE